MSRDDPQAANPVLTIGHSTRGIESFSDLLRTNDISLVADIRTIPRSRTNPQFNRETLPAELKQVRIKYVHMPGLGGLRRPGADSPNTGWRNVSFQGFADYMQTPVFEQNLEELIRISRTVRLVLMCAEAVPWRCHRSLIADALTIRDVQVEHILSAANRYPHKLTPFARIEGLKITYPVSTP
jgi:uncharacterized protein (DUF488 family)